MRLFNFEKLFILQNTGLFWFLMPARKIAMRRAPDGKTLAFQAPKGFVTMTEFMSMARKAKAPLTSPKSVVRALRAGRLSGKTVEAGGARPYHIIDRNSADSLIASTARNGSLTITQVAKKAGINPGTLKHLLRRRQIGTAVNARLKLLNPKEAAKIIAGAEMYRQLVKTHCTVTELAEKFGVGDDVILRAAYAGRIPYLKINPSTMIATDSSSAHTGHYFPRSLLNGSIKDWKAVSLRPARTRRGMRERQIVASVKAIGKGRGKKIERLVKENALELRLTEKRLGKDNMHRILELWQRFRTTPSEMKRMGGFKGEVSSNDITLFLILSGKATAEEISDREDGF